MKNPDIQKNVKIISLFYAVGHKDYQIKILLFPGS